MQCGFVLFHAGSVKGAKASDLDDCNCQCHIWYHLAPRCNSTRRRTNNQPQFQSRHICYRSHHIMFNSAVNPFAYALINQRFREKMKRLLCYSSILSELRSSTNLQSHSIELMNSNITQSRP